MWPLKHANEFLNKPEEWHAFVEGFLEPFTWFWNKPKPSELQEEIQKEHHYYQLGKAISATAIIAGITGLIIWRRRR